MSEQHESPASISGTLLTPRQVAEHLSCSSDLVIRIIHRRELAAICISKSSRSRKPRYRIRPEDLQKFIDGRYIQPPAVRQPRRGGYVRHV